MFDIGIDMLIGRDDDDDNSSAVSSGDGSSDCSSQHYSQDGAPLDSDGTPQLALELLPESTLEQQRAMDEFVNAPSRDKWLELVEKMRLQREEQMLQFYSDNPNVNENTVHRIPADPPLDMEEEIVFNEAHENDDMRGWSMRANEQDEEVSQQLKAMLNNSFRYNAHIRNYNNGNDGIFILDDNNRRGGNDQGFTSQSPKPLVISRRMMIGIFLLGFVLGSALLLASVSFYFNKKPREELNILNVGLRGHDTNSTSDIIEEMGKYSQDDDEGLENPEANINQDEGKLGHVYKFVLSYKCIITYIHT